MNRIVFVLLGLFLLTAGAFAQTYNTPSETVFSGPNLIHSQVMGLWRFDVAAVNGDNYQLRTSDTISGGAVAGVRLDTTAIYPCPADTLNWAVGLSFLNIDSVNVSITVDWYFYSIPDTAATPWLPAGATTIAVYRLVTRANQTPYALAYPIHAWLKPPGATHFRLRLSWAAAHNALTSGTASTSTYTTRPRFNAFYTWRERIE